MHKRIISVDPVTGRRKVVVINDEPSRTQQQFANSCDINNIMKQYNNNMSQIQEPVRGFYGDFSSAPDFFTARNSICQAQESFDKLPSHVRERFDNDPGKLLQFLDNKNNQDEAIKLGLVDALPNPVVPASNDDNLNDDDKGKQHKVSKASKSKDPSES